MSPQARALASLLLIGLSAGVGTAVFRAHQETAAARAAFDRAQVGGVLFQSDCATCHGVGGDGSGGAPVLDDGAVLRRYATEPALQRFIESNMPASDPGVLTPEQAGDAADYILWLNRRLP